QLDLIELPAIGTRSCALTRNFPPSSSFIRSRPPAPRPTGQCRHFREASMKQAGNSAASVAAAWVLLGGPVLAQQSEMTFFVTSVSPGKGADLGGLEGADAYCAKLAGDAGAGAKTWRA